MRSATPCCVSSLMWLPFVGKRQKTKANHLGQFPVDHDIGKYLPFGTLTCCSIPIFTAVTGSHFVVFYENLIIYVWPCKSFPIEKSKTSLLSLLLNSSLTEFLYELFIRQFWASASSYEWPTLAVPWNSLFLKVANIAWVQLFFLFLVVLVPNLSLYNCRLLLSDSLICAQWKQSGPACCLNVMFLLFFFCVVHFYPPTWSSCHTVLQTLLVEMNTLATVVWKYHVTIEVWLLNCSVCGDDCFSSGKKRERQKERNSEGSMLWKTLAPHELCGFSNQSLDNICRHLSSIVNRYI